MTAAPRRLMLALVVLAAFHMLNPSRAFGQG